MTSACLHTFERKNFIHVVAQFAKSATILATSRNGQTQCPFHELGNTLADFVKWAISQIERNRYIDLINACEKHVIHTYLVNGVVCLLNGAHDLVGIFFIVKL